jgi:4-hydroxybenzoate polyprenyltransferase
MSAGVMIANIIWNIANDEWDRRRDRRAPRRRREPEQSSPPIARPTSGPNASV